MFCLFLYVFTATAEISTVRGENTVEAQVVQRAPVATLAFHIGNRDDLRAT